MGDRRRSSCQICGRHRSEVGDITWSGNCITCAMEKTMRVTMSLHEHKGADFARWRTAHAASVGAIFPSEIRPPDVPQLKPNQQRNTRQSPQWRKMRDARLGYAADICEVRLPGCVKTATAVHLNPALGGNHRIAKLEDCRAVCVVCHGYIHGSVTPHETLSLLDDPPDAA